MWIYKLLMISALFNVKANAERKCTVDLGFILDQSSSINRVGGRFQNIILKFVKDAANRYGITKDGIHAGVIVYSDLDKTKVKINFKQCNDTQCFTDAVEGMGFDGGNTFTNEALKKADKELFNKKNGYRENVKAYAVLIADGGQTGPQVGGRLGQIRLEEEAKSAARTLRERGITVVVFGISVKPYAQNFLKSLASPGEYNDVYTFSDLQTFLDVLMEKVCFYATTEPPTETTTQPPPETTTQPPPETTTTQPPPETTTTQPPPETTTQPPPETTTQPPTETTTTQLPPETTTTQLPPETTTTQPPPETTTTQLPPETTTTQPPPVAINKIPACKPASLGFILDLSGSTSVYHKQEIEIIQGIVNEFDVKVGGSQAGLVTFSDSAVTRLAIGQISQLEQFNQYVNDISHTNGASYLNKALREANEVLFGSEFPVSESGRQKILFVITDGRQTEIYPDWHRVDLSEEIGFLRRQNVKIIVIAPGRNPDYFYLDQLVPIGQREMGVLYAWGKDIGKVVKKSVELSCWKRPKPAVSCRVALGFVLDASGTTRMSFKQEKYVLLELARGFVLQPLGTQAAVARFSMIGRLDIPFNREGKDSFNAFAVAVQSLQNLAKRTRVETGLDAIRTAFVNHNDGNEKILAIITDGFQSRDDFQPAIDAAESLRNEGFRIITVTLRSKLSLPPKIRRFLTRLSGNVNSNWFIPLTVYDVQNREWQTHVESAVRQIVTDICA